MLAELMLGDVLTSAPFILTCPLVQMGKDHDGTDRMTCEADPCDCKEFIPDREDDANYRCKRCKHDPEYHERAPGTHQRIDAE